MIKNIFKNDSQTSVNSKQVTIKLIIIFGLILALLIPQAMIQEIVHDRKSRQDEVEHNIATQIGGNADIVGPVISLPYRFEKETISYDENNKKKSIIEEIESMLYFTADELKVTSTVAVENKQKGIYKLPFFQSENELQATFSIPDFANLKIEEEFIDWEEAVLLMGVSDSKGIEEIPTLTIGDKKLNFSPASNRHDGLDNAIEVSISKENILQPMTIQLAVRGTKAVNFASTAKQNQLTMQSNWPHPNFESTVNYRAVNEYGSSGEQVVRENTLPTEKEISETGFTANWKENEFSMNQKTVWLATQQPPQLKSRLMGTEFVNMADHYQNTERSVKYMAMIIALVFMTFFIIELIKSTKVHPFQYIMVGSAIAVFFILLLAISEYTGFSIAYVIAAVATISLISLYSLSMFKSKSMAGNILLLLTALFIYLFTLLKAAQYSLLLGAVGLFVMIAIIMYVTRSIQWYQPKQAE